MFEGIPLHVTIIGDEFDETKILSNDIPTTTSVATEYYS